MRLTNMVMDRTVSEVEDRKRLQQRKEVGDAYRKNSQYFQYEKKPSLTELERLLTGEEDAKKFEVSKAENPEEKAVVQELKQIDRNVRAHEQAHMAAGGAVAGSASFSYTEGPDGKRYATAGEVPINPTQASTTEQTISVLEQVKRAALAPADPSPQDLRVAASVTTQIQQAKSQKTEENQKELESSDESQPAFLNEKTAVDVPERFAKNLELNAQQETVFGKSYADVYKERLFNLATERYTAHSQMAKNGYGVPPEPQFSLIA